jgi:hypothetical protein
LVELLPLLRQCLQLLDSLLEAEILLLPPALLASASETHLLQQWVSALVHLQLAQ